MPLSAHVSGHLDKIVGTAGYSVSGDTATLPTGSLDHRRLEELIDVAFQARHTVALVAGVITVKPRT
jgi:hypothetical protein